MGYMEVEAGGGEGSENADFTQQLQQAFQSAKQDKGRKSVMVGSDNQLEIPKQKKRFSMMQLKEKVKDLKAVKEDDE